MTVPKHIGIILDGNRRFAKRLMLKPWKGHEWGAQKFRQFLEWCNNAGVEEVTAYVFSIQNFNRPREEFDEIIRIFCDEFKRLLQPENIEKLKKDGVRINFVGRRTMLPAQVQELQKQLEDATQDNSKRRVNFAMAYGGREEIIDAVRRIAQEVKDGTLEPSAIDEGTISHELWLESEPDLIIRTGGEQRTSNFLPWQATYSELCFVDKYWPELEENDFKQILADYEGRERRFGR